MSELSVLCKNRKKDIENYDEKRKLYHGLSENYLDVFDYDYDKCCKFANENKETNNL